MRHTSECHSLACPKTVGERSKVLSIGFDPIKDFVEDGVRHLKELRLWEVSVVTFPMNEAAIVWRPHEIARTSLRSIQSLMVSVRFSPYRR
jgi:phage head maturation protease